MDTHTLTHPLLAYLLPPLPGVRVQQIGLFATDVLLRLVATAPPACCPTCDTPSSRVHSSYTRHLADLPWGRARVQIVLRVRKFRCACPTCPRRVFTERLPDLVAPYARQTARRQALVRSLGFALGGRAAVRLAGRLHLPTPCTSLLRLVRHAPRPPHGRLRVIGLDDWAWRRGHHYGTIIVDLERRQPVELLPDRSPEPVIAWLRRHPTIEIVSRDRASAYADAVTRGAPQALQVADRVHLLVNLADALQRLLDRYPGALQQVTEQAARQAALALGAPTPPAAEPSADPGAPPAAGAPGLPPPAAPSAPPAPTSPPVPPSRGAARSAERFAAVQAWQEQGWWGQRAIVRRLGLHRRTVRRYMVADQVPVRGVGRQAQSTARAYIPYLRRRWAEGCQNGVQLWEEL